jgi:hypothetical protein
MARLQNGGSFIGTIAGMTAYKLRGSDIVYLRSKRGPTRKTSRKSAGQVITGIQNDEFSIASKFASDVRCALYPVSKLGNTYLHSYLTGIAKKLQKENPESPTGQKRILISQHRYVLSGYQLNKKNTFDNIVGPPIKASIDKDTNTAVLQLPELRQGYNLSLPWQQPYYRFVIALGLIDDNAGIGKPQCPVSYVITEWLVSREVSPGREITVKIDKQYGNMDNKTALLAIGIEMGMQQSATEILAVKHQCAGKILAAE